MYDICIVGGGAAGMSCAITAGRLGLKVLLIDKNQKLGKKIYATGNGKCNLTNNLFDYKNHYNSSNELYVQFLENSLYDCFNDQVPSKQIIGFMESMGINTTNINNYIYPSSAQASSVVWAMIDELKQYNIDIILNTEVFSIEGQFPLFKIYSKEKVYSASHIILSCGGATYQSLGGTTSGYKLAKSLGHNIIPIRPSLCGIKVKEDLSVLAGVRCIGLIELLDGTNVVQKSYGEIQFRNDGLSGICIFEISSKAGKIINAKGSPKVKINFLDNQEKNINFNSKRTVIGLLNGYINDKLASYICNSNQINGKKIANELSSKEQNSINNSLRNTYFEVSKLYDLEQAQLTAGGVDIKEINSKTFESKKREGLYVVGELLDIDGICGGYNLSFSILSGIKAGKSIYDKIKSNKSTYTS